MILNTFAVLDGFVALLRLLLGMVLVCFGTAVWRTSQQANSAEARTGFEDRCYLLVLLAVLLLGLNLASWPLFYLLLQSYVKEWPGVMCIYGVIRIGTGTVGPSQWLPPLVQLLQLSKPVLVFASGSWLVLYLVNRQTPTAPLWNRLLAVLSVVGLLAVGDAALELAYLVIPKKEVFLALGCCAEVFDAGGRATRFLPQALVGEDYRPFLWGAYWGMNGAMVLATAGTRWRVRAGRGRYWLAGLFVGGLLCAAVNTVFLLEIAAPALLHLPYHHCPYDLIPKVPESVLGIALFVLASFCVGWAVVAAALANGRETRPYVRRTVVRLLSLGLVAYLNSLVLMALELALV
jgi:hypothetical protein